MTRIYTLPDVDKQVLRPIKGELRLLHRLGRGCLR